MNRTDRLAAILIMLQSRKIVRSIDIADKFNISQRTVYRDLKALDEAGVPIGAEAGVGYYLIDGFHLPPVMFNTKEAGAMLIAEKLVNCFSDESVRQNFGLASDKIKSVLPTSQQEFLGLVDQQIQILHQPVASTPNAGNNFIADIQTAISSKKCLDINYRSNSKKEDSNRIVEPVGLCFYGFKWHLIAFCQLRNDYRDFRLDRIKELVITSSAVSNNANKSISEYFEYAWQQEELFNVTVIFKSEALPHINNAKYYYGHYEETICGDKVHMKFTVSDYEYVANWILTLGDFVVDAKPKTLNELVRKKVQQLAAKYI